MFVPARRRESTELHQPGARGRATTVGRRHPEVTGFALLGTFRASCALRSALVQALARTRSLPSTENDAPEGRKGRDVSKAHSYQEALFQGFGDTRPWSLEQGRPRPFWQRSRSILAAQSICHVHQRIPGLRGRPLDEMRSMRECVWGLLLCCIVSETVPRHAPGMQPGTPLARGEGKRGAGCARDVSGRGRGDPCSLLLSRAFTHLTERHVIRRVEVDS